MAYCPKCGTNLPEGARFCGICGAQVTAPEAPAAQAAPSYAQYQQPASSGYGTQQQQYGQASSGYGAQQQQYQQPRQAAPGYGGYAQPSYPDDYGWSRPVQQKKPARHVGLLRLLSLLFALGLIVLAAGIGGNVYLNRFIDESAQNVELSSKERSLTVSGITASINRDAKAYKKAAKELLLYSLKEAYPDQYSQNKDQINEAFDTYLSSIDDSELREAMKEDYDANSKEYGFRWFILWIGANASLLMIVGGALAGVTLILWFVFGGASAGPGKTWLLPLLLVAVLLAAGIIVPCFLIEPIENISSDAVNKVGNNLDSSTLTNIIYMLQ